MTLPAALSKRDLALFEPVAGPPAKDEAAAKANALERAQANSDRLCRAFGAGTIYRCISSSPVAERWTCNKVGSGMVCGFEGQAACVLSQRLQSEQEWCG